MAKVLVIDDNKDILNLISELLILDGNAAITANNSKEALEVLVKEPKLDIILCDQNMPEMDLQNR